jgi:hypothetical protein
MLKRNSFIKQISSKIQKKFFFNFNFSKKSKLFAGKETSLILHPELAVEINDNNESNKLKINNRKKYEDYDKENDKNLIIDENVEFLTLDSNGIFNKKLFIVLTSKINFLLDN